MSLRESCNRIIAVFAAFANMLLVLNRKSFSAVTGPDEVEVAVFAFRDAALRAWDRSKWCYPNFLALTQFASTLEWFGALVYISTTVLGGAY